jgi:hypothetical protein
MCTLLSLVSCCHRVPSPGAWLWCKACSRLYTHASLLGLRSIRSTSLPVLALAAGCIARPLPVPGPVMGLAPRAHTSPRLAVQGILGVWFLEGAMAQPLSHTTVLAVGSIPCPGSARIPRATWLLVAAVTTALVLVVVASWVAVDGEAASLRRVVARPIFATLLAVALVAAGVANAVQRPEPSVAVVPLFAQRVPLDRLLWVYCVEVLVVGARGGRGSGISRRYVEPYPLLARLVVGG